MFLRLFYSTWWSGSRAPFGLVVIGRLFVGGGVVVDGAWGLTCYFAPGFECFDSWCMSSSFWRVVMRR